MVIQRIGTFTLDDSNPRFYTLCGKCHVKIAFIIITVLLLIMEVMEDVGYIFDDDFGENATWDTVFLSIFQLTVVILNIFAIITENQYLVIPYIAIMLISLTSLCFATVRCVYWILNPYDSFVSQLLHFSDQVSFIERESTILLCLAIISTTTTIVYWLTSIGTTCYQYFESKRNALNTKVASLPPMVNSVNTPTAGSSNQPVSSFANQNFSLSDNEEEPDDKVFEKKTGPGLV